MLTTFFQHLVSWCSRRGSQDAVDELTAAHLVGYHHDTRGLSGTSEPGNGEDFEEAGEEIVCLGHAHFFNEHLLVYKLGMDVVKITRCLERRASEAEERLVGRGVPALLHKPSRRLGAEPDAQDQRHRRDKSRAQL